MKVVIVNKLGVLDVRTVCGEGEERGNPYCLSILYENPFVHFHMLSVKTCIVKTNFLWKVLYGELKIMSFLQALDFVNLDVVLSM